jgi:hypothetical protein
MVELQPCKYVHPPVGEIHFLLNVFEFSIEDIFPHVLLREQAACLGLRQPICYQKALFK